VTGRGRKKTKNKKSIETKKRKVGHERETRES
jgi:hypothetical protein